MIIRDAREKDIESLMEIYNYAILHTTATFDLEPKPIEERILWFREHVGNHPLLVAEIEGNVAGYASLSVYRPKEAYESSVELSVYVDTMYHRKGVGRALMSRIIEKAREIPSIHTVLSVITSGNDASDRLHKAFGFQYCGTVKEAGKKFGRYLDVNTYQLIIIH